MSKSIETQIVINTSPEKIWDKLTDFRMYPFWNPFIKYIEGQPAIGAKLKVVIRPPNAIKMTFKPQIIACDKNQLFVWKGKLLVNGLFDGVHKFELVENSNGTTTFKQSEVFTGILTSIFNLDNTKEGFDSMNSALKQLCEQ